VRPGRHARVCLAVQAIDGPWGNTSSKGQRAKGKCGRPTARRSVRTTGATSERSASSNAVVLLGFEPRSPALQTVVLPLNYRTTEQKRWEQSTLEGQKRRSGHAWLPWHCQIRVRGPSPSPRLRPTRNVQHGLAVGHEAPGARDGAEAAQQPEGRGQVEGPAGAKGRERSRLACRAACGASCACHRA
jgi:hypothetical protein